MRSSKWWAVPLGLAGFHDCALALYHLVLPYQWGWTRFTGGLPDSIEWALYALNFSWSVLLFFVGGLVLYAARLGPDSGIFVRRMLFAVGLFWLVHGTYTWVTPLPMPASLAWLRYTLGAFPALVIALHWLPLYLFRRSTRPVPRMA